MFKKKPLYRMAHKPVHKSGLQIIFEAAMWAAIIILLVTLFFSFIGPSAFGW